MEDWMIYFIAFGIVFFIFVIGCVIGSFLNVVILRAFSGESIVLPPSKCPKCGNKLKWWHNIPILSYIFLRGKCGFCHEKISIQYPIVEFITGCLFVALFFKFGLRPSLLFVYAVASLLIVISVTDIKEKVVFDKHTYALVGIGLFYNLVSTVIFVWNKLVTTGFVLDGSWFFSNYLTMSLLGILVGVVIMEIAARIGYIIAGERAFGEGDTYIAAGLGAVFGWKNVIVILLMSIAIQLVMTLPLFLKKLYCNKKWQTLSALVSFFVYVIAYFVVQNCTELFENVWILLVAMIILAILGVWACVSVIQGLKDRDTLTYLPFGPAMAIAGIVMLFINSLINIPF